MHINRVLIVDDDPIIRKVAEISLSRVGKWTVMQAESGVQALSMAEEFLPDIILLDVMMPGTDGPTVFQRLSVLPSTATTPVIFMTAKVQRHEVQEYYALGAAGVITKPFDPLLLPGQIQSILSKPMGSTCIA